MGRSLPLWPFLQEVDKRAGKFAESLPLLSVSQTRGVVRFSEIFDKEPRAEDLSNYKLVEPEDLVINRMSADKGALGIASERGVASPDYMVLRSKGEVSPKYIAYLLKSDFGLSEIKKILRGIGTGDTNTVRTPRISRHELLHIKWPNIPNLEDQKRIADELDRELAEIDEFIAECTQLSTLTDERRLAAINSLIEPLLDNTTPIKHLGTLTSGLTLGATYNEPLKSYPYLRVANVQAGMVDLSDIKEVAVPPSVALENMLQKDDVLMTEGGDKDKLGRGAIWSDEISPMLHQNHVFAFRCNKEKLLPEFLVYCLESSYARRYFENNARQSTNLASTNSNIVKNFITPIINTSSQQDIIKLLTLHTENLTSIKKNTSRVLNLLLERRKSTLEAYLSL